MNQHTTSDGKAVRDIGYGPQESENVSLQARQDHYDYCCHECNVQQCFSDGVYQATSGYECRYWDASCFIEFQQSPSGLDPWAGWTIVYVTKMDMDELLNILLPFGSDVIPLIKWKTMLRDEYCQDHESEPESEP